LLGGYVLAARAGRTRLAHQLHLHLHQVSEPDAFSSTDIDEFNDNLDDLLLPDLAQQTEKMSVFNTTSTRDAPDLIGSDSNRSEKTTKSKSLSDLEENLDLLLKIKNMGTILLGSPRFQHLLRFQRRVLPAQYYTFKPVPKRTRRLGLTTTSTLKVVPSSSTALVKLKDAIEFSGGCSMNTLA
jgi:hypothetical protein